MAKDVIHISEAEAASDFAALMARVRAGAEIVIENGELNSIASIGSIRALYVSSRDGELCSGRGLDVSVVFHKLD